CETEARTGAHLFGRRPPGVADGVANLEELMEAIARRGRPRACAGASLRATARAGVAGAAPAVVAGAGAADRDRCCPRCGKGGMGAVPGPVAARGLGGWLRGAPHVSGVRLDGAGGPAE